MVLTTKLLEYKSLLSLSADLLARKACIIFSFLEEWNMFWKVSINTLKIYVLKVRICLSSKVMKIYCNLDTDLQMC